MNRDREGLGPGFTLTGRPISSRPRPPAGLRSHSRLRRRARPRMRPRLRPPAWMVWLAALLLLILLAPHAARLVYPLHYQEIIAREADRAAVDPMLVAAVIRVESRYDPRAVSRTGAVGLMQIMPETGDWIAAQLGLEPPSGQDLTDPDINIRLGTWYLAHLLAELGDLPLALAAYNAGRGQVSRWLAEGRFSAGTGDLDVFLEQVPFPETRSFVRRVLTDLRVYRLLY